MMPTLLELGPFTLSSLWAFGTVGFIMGTLLFLKKAKYERTDLMFLLDHSFSLLIGTILISRLTFLLMTWGYFGPVTFFGALKQICFFWITGYSFWGALVGFGLIFLFHCYRKGQNPMEWLEVAIVPFFIGVMIGNFGQFLDGQGYGKETNLPWGVTFESTAVKYTVPIHPTQIYSMLIILIILITRNKMIEKWPFFKEKYNWTLFAIACYSFARFWLEFLRGDDTLQLGIVRLGHILTLALFVPLAIVLYKKYKKFSNKI